MVRGGILKKDGNFIKVLQVTPINFELKSDFEQEAILECYKRFLKSCSFDMQLIVQTHVTDISKHLAKVKRLSEEEDILQDMAKDYINFVQEITSSRKNVSRRFYIIMLQNENTEENICKIKEGLGTCGNFVEECSEEEIILMLKNCFNKRLRMLERKKL